MKTYLRVIVLAAAALLVCFAASARRNPGEKVGVTFSEMIYDFGNAPENGSPVTHEFTYTNSGTSALSILWAKASCGCTVPEYSRKPLQPGETAKIKVKFNTKGQKGEVDKDVRLRFKNGNGQSENITLRLVGVVVPAK